MKTSLVGVPLILLSLLCAMCSLAMAQPASVPAMPPVEQPLVREGDLAVSLAGALGLGSPEDELEAQNMLNSAGISPRNGWIADYPVTPDIAGELQASVADAADTGRLTFGKDEALMNFQDVLEAYGLAIRATDAQGARAVGDAPVGLDTYYTAQGPPVVTYYAPPPAYAYLYTWVPYPFWWWNIWYPGFFVLVDFDLRLSFHERVIYHPPHRPYTHYYVMVRKRHHDRSRLDYMSRQRVRDRRPGDSISNYYHDRKTGRVSRIDPTRRSPRPPVVESPGTRGFGPPRAHGGTRSSAFDRFGSSRVDGAASDRGFKSRSKAGIIPAKPPARPGRQSDRQALDRSAPSRRGDDRRALDERKEGFRDARGGTFHGGGRRQQR